VLTHERWALRSLWKGPPHAKTTSCSLEPPGCPHGSQPYQLACSQQRQHPKVRRCAAYHPPSPQAASRPCRTRLGNSSSLRLTPKLGPSTRTSKAPGRLQENPAANDAFCNTSWANRLHLIDRSASPRSSRTTVCFTLQEFPHIFRPLSFLVTFCLPHVPFLPYSRWKSQLGTIQTLAGTCITLPSHGSGDTKTLPSLAISPFSCLDTSLPVTTRVSYLFGLRFCTCSAAHTCPVPYPPNT